MFQGSSTYPLLCSPNQGLVNIPKNIYNTQWPETNTAKPLANIAQGQQNTTTVNNENNTHTPATSIIGGGSTLNNSHATKNTSNIGKTSNTVATQGASLKSMFSFNNSAFEFCKQFTFAHPWVSLFLVVVLIVAGYVVYIYTKKGSELLMLKMDEVHDEDLLKRRSANVQHKTRSNPRQGQRRRGSRRMTPRKTPSSAFDEQQTNIDISSTSSSGIPKTKRGSPIPIDMTGLPPLPQLNNDEIGKFDITGLNLPPVPTSDIK